MREIELNNHAGLPLPRAVILSCSRSSFDDCLPRCRRGFFCALNSFALGLKRIQAIFLTPLLVNPGEDYC